MELPGFMRFLAIAVIVLASQILAYHEPSMRGSSFIEQKSLGFGPKQPRFRATHWEAQAASHQSKADDDSDQQEENTSDSNEKQGDTKETDYIADLKSDLEQIEAEAEQAQQEEEQEAENESQEGQEAENESQEEDESKTDTSPADSTTTTTITTVTTQSRAPLVTTQRIVVFTTTQVPLNNGNGNAAKIYVFNKEGKQVSLVSTPASAEQLKAAVVAACKSQHVPLDRKTTCYCQYGPLPKKKKKRDPHTRHMRNVVHTVASMRCNCERNNTLGVHEEAVRDAIAMKSLRTQTRNITEQTLRHFATEELRNKMNAIIVQQVKESQEVKQTMQNVQTKAQKAFEKMEAQAGRKRAEKVLPELDYLIEDEREYRKRLREMEALRAQKEQEKMAALKHKNHNFSRDILLKRVKEKEEQVRRLREGILLVSHITEQHNAMMAARERKREERHRFDNETVVEWEILLRDLYDQSKDLLDKELAELLKHWKDKTDALKARLEHLQNMNASDFGRDKRIANMEDMIKRWKARVGAEQRLLDKELRDYSSPCSSNAQCRAYERCVESACMGVAINSTCATPYDCGNMQVCKQKLCVAMTPPAGSPCTSTADCGEGAKCSENKCVIVSVGAPCIAHADCAKAQLCQAEVCQWMQPAPGLPCIKDPEGFDNCTIGQRCDSNNECQVISEGTRCKTHQECASGQGCIGLKCRFFTPPTGSPCMKTEECAVGHRCIKNVCDLRQSGKVCTKQEDCGFAQRCDQGLCRLIDRGTECAGHTECGNGQRCVSTKPSESGKCEGFSSRGRTCAGNSECPMFFRCIFGKCSRVLAHAHCTDVSQCGNRMVCTQFVCMPDESFPGLKSPRLHRCKATRDCHDSRDCVVGWCMVVPRELANCKDKSSCGNEQSCSANVCVARYASGYPQEGGLCKQKQDCANGQICYKQRCHDKGEGLSCKKSEECGLAQQCLDSRCVSDGATCTSDVNCFTFQTCLSGRCASVFPGSPCLAHSDCGNEQLCDLAGKQRQCQKASPGLNGSCRQDSDCGTGMRCDGIKGKCVWVPVGTLCQTNGFVLHGMSAIAGLEKPPPPCGNGQVCFVQACVWTSPAEGAPCKTSFDCGTDQSCAGDKQKPTTCITVPQGKGCTDHPDCGNGQLCVQYKCLRASEVRRRRNNPKALCKRTSECAAREICTGGQCVGQFHRGQDVPDGSPCTSQSACGFGQKCIASACRIIPKDNVCKSSADCGNGRQCAKGVCLDTPAGTPCGGRYNDEEEEQNKQNKPAAPIGGECGVHQMCRMSRCRDLFGGHVATAVAPGTKCLTHSECSFRQRCVRSRCKLVQGKVHCTSNGDCGNGQMCLGMRYGRPGLCTVVPEGKKCLKSSSLFNKQDDFVPPPECSGCSACVSLKGDCNKKTPKAKCMLLVGSTWCGPPDAGDATTSGNMCANGQLCLGGACHNQFGAVAPTHFARGVNSLPPSELLRAHWVPEGTLCKGDQDCGAAQVCGDDLHCSSVRDGSRCQLTKHCGNGQRCTPGFYLCQMEREGGACRSDTDCPKTSACVADHCVYQFGHLLGYDLAKRSAEDFNMMSEWRAQISVMLKKAMAQIEAKQKNSSYDMELAHETKQLEDEYAKLAIATKVLGKEVKRRVDKLLTSSDVEGGGSTCALCIAEQDIQKLLDEIERLKSVLERCKRHPEAYIPSCEQDLNFQINKLKEEVTRRRALLEEEVRQLHEEERRLQKQLNACRSGAGGCEQTSEHRLLLQIMRAQDQLYRRRKKKRMDDQLLVLKCLWNARKTPQAEKVAIFFKSSVPEGCDKTEREYGAFLRRNQTSIINKTEALMQNQTRSLKDCLCKDYLSEKQVADEARKRVQQANAAWKTATDNAATQQERAAAERRKQKEVADRVAKQLVFDAFMKNGDWKSALQKLRDQHKDQVGKMTEEANREVQANSKPPPQPDDKIDLNKLTDCVAPIADLTVRQNIKSTFTEGPARNGCALLSLAKTHVIHMAYLCLCDAAGTAGQ